MKGICFMEIRSIAEIISDVLGVGLALISLIISLKADKKVDEYKRNEEHNKVGSLLQVWWAKKYKTTEENEIWGLVVVNSADNFSVLRDVKIEYAGKSGKFPSYTARYFPPGKYFLPAGKLFVQNISDISNYEPIIKSEDYIVRYYEFKTADNRCWVWSLDDGIKLKNM